jgi:23S rRNA (adenine2503-C2)-methyltransferase
MLALYRPDISELLDRASWPLYRHLQVYEHLLRQPLRPFSEATSLPTEARVALETLGCSTLAQLEERVAPDGTSKLLLAGRDGRAVEAVLMRYQGRVTVCVSSQVGCPVGCMFCATGAMGFHRNLSTGEIVDQIRTAMVIASGEDRRVSNVVYMGMGEPLLNLKSVVDSIRVLTDPRGIGMAHRAISVSTVGIPSGMIRLGRAEPQVNLALSLHAPDDDTRSLLVPDRYRHPVAEILHAAWEHFALTRRKLLIEYVLIRDVNDSPQHARALAQLLRGHVVTVNLLAWNPVSRGRDAEGHQDAGARASRFQPSTPAALSAFRETLVTHHVETVVRRSKGGAIQAACGQLAGKRAPDGKVPCGDASADLPAADL